MPGIRRIFAPVALAALALTLGGCLKLEQKLTVLADGSGKYVMLFGVKEMKEFGGEMQADLPESGSPDDLDESFRGYVAAAKPKQWEKDGWKFVEFSVYFEDVNEFKVIQKADDEGGGMDGDAAATTEVVAEFSFTKTDGGHRLTITNNAMKDFGDAGGDEMDLDSMPEEQRAMVEMMMERMLAGFSISESYTLPGAVTAAEGLPKKSGRTASLSVTGDDVKSPEKRAKLAKSSKRTVDCGASSMTADEIKAFKDEMARAKDEWAKMRAAARGDK